MNLINIGEISMVTEKTEHDMAKARMTRLLSFFVAFIASIALVVEIIEFNKVALNDSQVHIPSLISLTNQPSYLAYASIFTLALCLLFIVQSTRRLPKK